MMQYPTKYQLTLRCATWHDITSKIYIKSRISEICESRAIKRYIDCPNRLISWMSRFRPQTLPTWEQNGAVCLLIIFRSNHQTNHLVCSLWVIIEESIKLDSVEVYFIKVDVSIPTTFSIVVEFFYPACGRYSMSEPEMRWWQKLY